MKERAAATSSTSIRPSRRSRKAVDEAEVMAGLQIESVYVGVAGDHIRSVNSRGVISVTGKAS